MTPVKLLIVDDDPFVLDMLSSILAATGYNIQTAENGKEAFLILQEQPDIGLVISDMNMEEMSGLELIRQIRDTGADLPIIILTVNENVTIAIEALKSGASDYLLKDENIAETIPVAVERVMDKYLLQQRNEQLRQALETKNRELEKSNTELAELNILKNKFLGMAAHDIRNPLTSIRGFTELFLSGEFGLLSDEQKEFIAIIHQTSGEMLALLNDLLDISVIESGKLKLDCRDESLADLLLTRLRLSRVMARKKNIQIKADLEDVPPIPCDASRIGQVIDNLLSNAIKYSPPGSTVFVSLKNNGDLVELSVRDCGPGIADEEKEYLFNTYQRLSAKPTGGETSTGLGLAIVKKIIDAHRGDLEVQSSPGSGSSFIFRLPVHS